METRWVVLSILFAGSYTSLVGDAVPFGMFVDTSEHNLVPEIVEDAIFGMFDAVCDREIRIIEAQIQAEQEAQQQRAQDEAYVAELLAMREAQRVLRNQHRVEQSPETQAVCYKLRNRLHRMASMQKVILRENKELEVTQLIQMHRATRPSFERTYRVLCDSEVTKDRSLLQSMQKDMLLARCDKVKKYTDRYQQIVSTLLDTQYHMTVSLKKQLEQVCALAGREPITVLAQLTLHDGQGRYSNMITSDILSTRYVS